MPRRAASTMLARKLGARLRALREEAALTQESVAWASGFSKSYVSQLESGRVAPSVRALTALAKRLGVAPFELLAIDERDPRTMLVDAVRRRDRAAVIQALGKLGISV